MKLASYLGVKRKRTKNLEGRQLRKRRIKCVM